MDVEKLIMTETWRRYPQGKRESKHIKWKEKLVLRGTYIAMAVAKREGEANTHTQSREGESVMRIRLSNSARQNGPLKMEINIRRNVSFPLLIASAASLSPPPLPFLYIQRLK
jgi:hypothetical protein